jgi:3-hydroxyacyl-CoA dehydrogenase
MTSIHRVAVLGAGTMGSQIAAHCANAGLSVLLLDLDRPTAERGLERARTLKPDPFFTPDAVQRIAVGGFDTDLGQLATCDWIVEAIVERLDAKRALLAQVDGVRGAEAIVSTNTSGLSIAALAEGRSDSFRRQFLGTHFFNPPRYLHLLEIVPGPETDPAVLAAMSSFADRRLGKGVVVAKDTPNFIANHIGLYGVLRIFEVLATGQFSIEEIDAMTGPAIGRPKSATFRTLDLAGLDVLADVARNLTARPHPAVPDPGAFRLPGLVEELVRRGWVGEKAGRGFYRRERRGDGSEILVLDPATMEYRPPQPVKLPSLEAARSVDDPAERIRTLFLGRDRVGEFLRATLGRTLIYAARVAPDIAHSIDDVDRAMRWGFNWELGPFETWDAIGVQELLEACQVASPPPLVQEVLDRGANRFREAPLPPAAPDLMILSAARARGGVLRRNPGASLVDLGDGVLAVALHSKMNTIGADTVEMLHAGVKEASRQFAALVVATEAANFSAGANLMLLLLEAQEGNWDEIDRMVRAFQQVNLALRYADVPVVVAPAGVCLAGGCEIALHADRVQAAAEAYLGLVEVGVGLIPAGGGCKEMLARAMEAIPADTSVDPFPYVQRAFETIALAKVSTSAPDARRLGYLREVDGITMNTERLVSDAKALALARVREGYQPPPRRHILVGGEPLGAALKLGVHLAWRAGRISDHDALVGRKLAWVMSGGGLPHATRVDEQYVLDLEREAFVSLCGEPKTRERMAYTLKTGKPLRN